MVLQRLSDNQTWNRLEAGLWETTCAVYDVPLERVRLDSTTSCGFHTIVDDGLMQLGHSKDHRPDLAQFKLMAAAAEPRGQLIACDVHPGDAADDPLYLPMIGRVRALLGRTGLLYAGDCKMAALETRAEIQARGDYYLTPLPMTGETKDQFDTWVEDAVSGPRRVDLVAIGIGEETIGTGYEFTRDLTATVDDSAQTWIERVQVLRSDSLAETQAHALRAAVEEGRGGGAGADAPSGAGQGPVHHGLGAGASGRCGPGRARGRGVCSRWPGRQERPAGPGTSDPVEAVPIARRRRKWTIRYQITTVRRNEPAIRERVARMGWRVQVTNLAARTDVAGGLGGGVPRRLLPGAGFPLAEGSAVGDPAAVRAS